MWKTTVTCAIVTVFMLVAISHAQVPLRGYFIAFEDCEANKKKTSDNPGNIKLEPLRAYEMIGQNNTPGTHYQVKVVGAPVTEARWVPMTCGAYAPQDQLVIAGNGGANNDESNGLVPNSIENVLAASWQPGFCATRAGQSKTECRTQTADRPDARQFSIHGLWPDNLHDKAIFPCYCDKGRPVSCGGSSQAVRSIELSDSIRERLQVLMPGFASGLHLHEWTKHGSCYEDDQTEDKGADPDEYYGDTMALLEQLNNSEVRALFEANIGNVLTLEQVQQAFQEAFGDGAGERFHMVCNTHRGTGDTIIAELWISLTGHIRPDSNLGELILASPTRDVSSSRSPCARGLVVRVEG